MTSLTYFISLIDVLILIVGEGNCRPRRVRRIVHGFPAEPQEFPWSAALIRVTNGDVRFCGGSVISSGWILTAAHCFLPYDTANIYNIRPDLWQVRIGTNVHWTEFDIWKFNLEMDFNTGRYIHDLHVTEIITHPLYNSETSLHDIALVRLAKRINFSLTSNVQPLSIPSSKLMAHVKIGSRCVLSGWGCTDPQAFQSRSGEPPARHLRKADMYIFYPAVCQLLYGPFMNVTSDLCAISDREHVNVCSGDSGSPLVCYDEDGKPFQAGITSGVFTHSPIWEGNPPAIFTKVSNYVEWIQDVTNFEITIRKHCE